MECLGLEVLLWGKTVVLFKGPPVGVATMATNRLTPKSTSVHNQRNDDVLEVGAWWVDILGMMAC